LAGFERPKAEALGYPEARARAKATTKARANAEADPYGMTNKKGNNKLQQQLQ
jgi:hypothetical protein